MYTGCKNSFSEGVLWTANELDQLITMPCSKLHPSFRYSVSISRHCKSDGTWSPVDLRNCTMFTGSKPVVIVYFTVPINITFTTKINEVSCVCYQLNHLM